jgi:alpha-galactosidase
MIHIGTNGPTFHLQAGGVSYIMSVLADRHLVHGYWGAGIEVFDPAQLYSTGVRPYSVSESIDSRKAAEFHKFWVSPEGSLSDKGQLKPDNLYSPERLPLEYPTTGNGDLRESALGFCHTGGNHLPLLEYRDYELINGVPGPDGLPYISDPKENCKTLRITLVDRLNKVEVELFYLPLPDLPVILRWARIRNSSDQRIVINKAYSASLDLPGSNLDLTTLNGSWGRERHLHRRHLAPGLQAVESRGGASGHQHSPVMVLSDRDSTENNGRAWSMSLIYSGNHRHSAEVNQYGASRLQCGINPNGFQYELNPEGYFDTPAAVLVSSITGQSGISDGYHQFVRHYLLPTQWRDRDRPIVVNTWEAHYFDVNSKNVLELARQGKGIGGEVLVLDDGWFKNRKDDKRALGDWFPDSGKFPEGISETAKAVRAEGMDFGIWVEPEMVNPESELYRRHPDWVLGSSERNPVLARNQLVLNLGKSEVVEYLLDLLSGLFSSGPISYVKWDMNRYMAEIDDPGAPHRYMLGLYRLWATLVDRFPHILFEGCAGGGGRFDFGSLAYMPQFWTSDQTDALERQRIQYGSSLLFPPETMGAHISAVPNHQLGRVTPAEVRGLTALCFNFGFELDLQFEPEADKVVYRRLSELYKEYRGLFRTGRFHRLLPRQYQFSDSSSHPRDPHAWSIVSLSRDVAFVFFFQALAEPNDDGLWLQIPGLDENAEYRDEERDTSYDSAFLENRGLWIPPAAGDYRSVYWILTRRTGNRRPLR